LGVFKETTLQLRRETRDTGRAPGAGFGIKFNGSNMWGDSNGAS
jgi:hypothetical protein